MAGHARYTVAYSQAANVQQRLSRRTTDSTLCGLTPYYFLTTLMP